MKREIIILTKSSKRDGYCVAGIDANTGEWIRLVTDDDNTEGAVPKKDMIYGDRNRIEIYDRVSVDLIKRAETEVQPENWLYNREAPMEKIGESNLEEVIEKHKLDNPKCIFVNNEKSLDGTEINNLEGSLLLVKVDNPRYFIKTFEKQKVQLNFEYNGEKYSFFPVSQIDKKDFFKNMDDGFYPSDSNIFVFSLTNKYTGDGRYYKMMAQELC